MKPTFREIYDQFSDETLDLQSVSEAQKFSHLGQKLGTSNNFVFSLVANTKIYMNNERNLP